MTAESAILPPGSASTGYTNTAVLGSDSLSSSPTPPIVENRGSDNLTSFQPSSISQSVNPPSSTRTNVQVNPLGSPPNTQLPNHGQMLPPPSDDSRPPQQVFISQAQRAIPVIKILFALIRLLIIIKIYLFFIALYFRQLSADNKMNNQLC